MKSYRIRMWLVHSVNWSLETTFGDFQLMHWGRAKMVYVLLEYMERELFCLLIKFWT